MALPPSNTWIINATEAQQWLKEGATVLDVRNPIRWFFHHVSGAVRVSWRQFSQPSSPHRGKLLNDPVILTEKIQALGIDRDRPVLVIGQPPQGWGEDGRIVWTLKTLGHPRVALVDGGQRALDQAGVPSTWGWFKPQRGSFEATRSPQWEIQRDDLKQRLEAGTIKLLDTREPREYAGATPYGEQRGGHLPGAKPLYFKELLTDEGYILPADQIRAKLAALGIQPDDAIAVYCTGGVRSAWVVSVLTQSGYKNPLNYAGSTWEWAASNAKKYPLEILETGAA